MSEVSEHKAIVVAAITRTQDCHLFPPSQRWMSRTPPRGEIQAASFSLHSCADLSRFVVQTSSFAFGAEGAARFIAATHLWHAPAGVLSFKCLLWAYSRSGAASDSDNHFLRDREKCVRSLCQCFHTVGGSRARAAVTSSTERQLPAAPVHRVFLVANSTFAFLEMAALRRNRRVGRHC
jgi:hypothetical protein